MGTSDIVQHDRYSAGWQILIVFGRYAAEFYVV